MSHETPDQVAPGGNDIYVIPIDREAAKAYIYTLQHIPAIIFGIGTLGIGYLAWLAYYSWFGKWLIEQQVEALQYRIEGRTLRVDSGVFFLKRKGVPLDRITDFALVQGPVMRMLGIWALQVQTAGVGTAMPEATLIAIENPESVRDELLRRRDAAAQGNRRDYC